MSPITVAAIALALFVICTLPIWALLYARGEDERREVAS